jgi:hypothetical protein
LIAKKCEKKRRKLTYSSLLEFMYMKTLTLSFLCLFISLSCSAQELSLGEQRKVSISLLVGPSVTTAFGPEVEHQLEPYQSYDGFMTNPVLYEHNRLTFFANCTWQLSKVAFAKSGFGFLEKGTKIENRKYVYPIDVRNQYLTLPVLLGADPLNLIFPEDGVSLSLEGGIAPSLPIYTQQYAPWGPYGRSHVKEHRVIVALQWGATLEIAIIKKLHIAVNYSGYRDLNAFYFNPDRASGSPTGRAMFFKGYWVTGGIGYTLR